MAKKTLNGSELVGYIKERQAKQVRALRQAHDVVPKLVIIRTNPDPVVDSYMKIKCSYGEDIQVETKVKTIEQKEATAVIQGLNSDPAVHGIIVQIPLPDKSQTTEILNSVAPEKDVDGLRSPDAPWPYNPTEATHMSVMQGSQEERANRISDTESERQTPADTAVRHEPAGMPSLAGQQGKVMRGSLFDAPTPLAISWLLAGYNIDFTGKHIVIVGHGRLVGRPLAKMWQASGYDIEVADKNVANLADVTRGADILVSATGVPGLITKEMVKPEAIIVDAGVSTDSNGLVGDVAPDVREMPGITITPEKGGVGPLTVSALFDNVIRAARATVEQKT